MNVDLKKSIYRFSKLLLLLIMVGGAVVAQESDKDQNQHEDTELADCIDVDKIKSYKTQSDKQVLLQLLDLMKIMKLSKGCHNLHFHKYISYVPLNGKICVKLTEIKSRSGHSCRILSFDDVESSNIKHEDSKKDK